jgi:hypothetical protein
MTLPGSHRPQKDINHIPSLLQKSYFCFISLYKMSMIYPKFLNARACGSTGVKALY